MFQLLGGYYIIRLILYHLVRSGFFVFGVGPGYPSMELVPVFGLPVRPLPSALFQKAPGYSRPYMLGYLLSQAAAQRSAAISATTRLTPCPTMVLAIVCGMPARSYLNFAPWDLISIPPFFDINSALELRSRGATGERVGRLSDPRRGTALLAAAIFAVRDASC